MSHRHINYIHLISRLSVFIGQSAERLSRKYTIILGSIIFMIGCALQTAANGYALMVTGRAVAGLGVGSLSMIVPLYQVK